MDTQLQFFLIILISYLGLLAGAIISHYAKEELASGKKYFRIGRPIVFGLVAFFFFFQLKINYIFSIPASIFSIAFAYVFSNMLRTINPGIFFYSFFALVLFEVRRNQIFAIVSSLIFIFGILDSSISLEGIDSDLITKVRLMLLSNIAYLILGVVLFLSFTG